MKSRLLFILIALLTAVGVVLPVAAQAPTANLTECVKTFDEKADYFPEKVTVDTASGFTVEYHSNYKVVTVTTPWQGAKEPLVYVLVQCGTPAPELKAGETEIDVPVQSVVSLSTSFLPHLTSQNLLDKVVAVDTSMFTINDAIVNGVKDGKIAEVGGGGGGTEINVEKLIELQPGLILSQRFSDEDKAYPAMLQAKLPVVIDADFLDQTPLGVAEWGKFISVFFNTEAIAQKAFTEVNDRYEKVATLAKSATKQPTVFVNTPYSGTWYMPGGESYVATLLRDAGADYLWADDTTTGSIGLSFEEVLDQANDADYWVNVFATSKADVLAGDERLGEFGAFKSGQIYTNNARSNANGGSDYYEGGYANPDLILSDLVKIFHPDLLPDYSLYFYAPLGN